MFGEVKTQELFPEGQAVFGYCAPRVSSQTKLQATGDVARDINRAKQSQNWQITCVSMQTTYLGNIYAR